MNKHFGRWRAIAEYGSPSTVELLSCQKFWAMNGRSPSTVEFFANGRRRDLGPFAEYGWTHWSTHSTFGGSNWPTAKPFESKRKPFHFLFLRCFAVGNYTKLLQLYQLCLLFSCSKIKPRPNQKKEVQHWNETIAFENLEQWIWNSTLQQYSVYILLNIIWATILRFYDMRPVTYENTSIT